jgi:hypothetical protein
MVSQVHAMGTPSAARGQACADCGGTAGRRPVHVR